MPDKNNDENDKTNKLIYLAWIYGKLNHDFEDFESKHFEELNIKELKSIACDKGMLVDWD